MTTTIQYFGAQLGAYSLAPPLLRTPCYQDRTQASLLTCWPNFGLVELGNARFHFRTYWVTLINFGNIIPSQDFGFISARGRSC